MDVRPATRQDMDGVLQLQSASFIGNLSDEDRGSGFVSVEFTSEQFDAMARDCALIVAVEQQHVLGYLCSASIDYCRQFPLLAALVQRFPELRYAERPLDSYRTFVYGPVCIARSQRGRGLLCSLYRELLHALGTTYDLGVALISKDNPRSFEAHVRKLGMTLVGEYGFRRQQYNIVAFHIPSLHDQTDAPKQYFFLNISRTAFNQLRQARELCMMHRWLGQNIPSQLIHMRQALLNRHGQRSAMARAMPLLAALFALVSCATQFDMSDQRIARPGPEWGVVIGSVVVQPERVSSVKPATEREASSASYEFDIAQIQLSDPDGTGAYAKQYRLNTKAGEERTFISRLPPGQYIIREFHEEGVVGLAGELDVIFTVAPGEIRYIGRVRVEIPRRASSGKPYRFAIENAREVTLALVSKQHPGLTSAVVDGPLQVRMDPAP